MSWGVGPHFAVDRRPQVATQPRASAQLRGAGTRGGARRLGATLAAVLGVIVSLSCGGGSATHKPGVAAPARRPAREVKPAALKELDAGLRAMRLGGPEAPDRAAEAFQRATAADPTLWEAWHDLGVARARGGDDRGAIAAYGKALELEPGHAPSLLARAEAERRLGRRDEARADYEKALGLDPDDLQTRLRLASLLREAGDTEGSLRAVREVLKRKAEGKELADANVELGLIYLGAGREELAQLVLSKAASADAKNPRVWNALGLLALKQGKDQEAFQRLDQATELDPSFRDARFNKASVLLDAGDYAAARAELQAALKGQEDGADVDALVALGVAERGLGDYPAARATWQRVLKVAPRDADALFNLAVLHMDFLKDEAQARELLARYKAAAPDDHPRQKDADARLGELGPAPAPPAPALPPAGAAPAKPKKRRSRRNARTPGRQGRRSASWCLGVSLLLLLSAGLAEAAPRRKPAAAKAEKAEAAKSAVQKEKTFDFAAMGIEGRVLAPQLLYLLGRIKVELERGDLEARSFVPELVRSVDEGGL